MHQARCSKTEQNTLSSVVGAEVGTYVGLGIVGATGVVGVSVGANVGAYTAISPTNVTVTPEVSTPLSR